MEENQKNLVNRVARSGIQTLDLATLYPDVHVLEIDLKDFLFHGLILREKEFRTAMEAFDWTACSGKIVLVHCSSDAIIAMWAYMLVAQYAQPWAESIFYGNREEYLEQSLLRSIGELNISRFEDKRVVVKGCGDIPVPASAYVAITTRLRPVVRSLMYGEPCSTVPIYKRKKFPV